jgi:dephospho-CoA kinase
MKVLGITGGIGMGKSTSAEFLRQRGVAVVDTDVLAREVVEPGSPALAEIVKSFGFESLDAEGRLRRGDMARRVFADDAARSALENIIHPRIRERWLQQVETWRGEGRPLAAVVIPLLYETNAQSHFDAILCVACSPQSQQQRLVARGWSPDQITQRLRAQWPVAKKIELADYLIWTESTPEVHAAQLDRVLKQVNGAPS